MIFFRLLSFQEMIVFFFNFSYSTEMSNKTVKSKSGHACKYYMTVFWIHLSKLFRNDCKIVKNVTHKSKNKSK